MAVVYTLPNLAWIPNDIRNLEPADRPLPYLNRYGNGLIYLLEGCWYTYLLAWGIKEHCKDKYGWVNQQKRGGDTRWKSKYPGDWLWREG
jgi:hypothetical protein